MGKSINRMNGFSPGLQRVDKRELYLKGIRSVVLLGDNGCRPPTKESIAVFRKILKIKTDFFIIIGDLVLWGKDEEFKKLSAFCKKRVRVPIFTLAGNHDLPGFSKFHGLSTYAIILDNFVFLCLDNSRRKFAQKELNFMVRELKKHKGKKFFILFHIPPPTQDRKSCIDDLEWKKIKEVMDNFKEKIVCIFSGHIHAFWDYYLDGYRIFISGGGGSQLFNLEKDPIKTHHAIRLIFTQKDSVRFNLIPIDRKISGAAKTYLDMRLK